MFTMDDVGILADYIVEMLACLDELMTEEISDLNIGQAMAYRHILRLIQGSIVEDDLKKELGLDIDLDIKYGR